MSDVSSVPVILVQGLEATFELKSCGSALLFELLDGSLRIPVRTKMRHLAMLHVPKE